ncbi:MAG: hypothetical protein EP346_02935 [Bacteroidetes bacterium]|nr:MAG: hypothetical protein EP346_02935 [Bacteroidota bacterium]
MASKPIFMIGFTVLALVVSGSMVYNAMAEGEEPQWSSIAFGLGVVILLWYTRMTSKFYVRIHNDRIEWKVTRSNSEKILAKDVEVVDIYALSVDFVTKMGTVELSLANFDKGPITGEVVDAIKAWATENGIKVEE